MKLRFLLLDASYEIWGGEPVIVLWALNEEGDPIVLFDKGFRPYFYVLPGNEFTKDLSERLFALSEPKSPIISVELVERKYFGRRVRVFKVTTVIPEYVRMYREKARVIPGVEDVLEADVRFAFRYLIDMDLKPFRWYEAEVNELERPGYRVKGAYLIETRPPKEVEENLPYPPLKIMGFDIEVFNSSGSPRASRDPIIIIGTIDGGVKQFWTKESSDSSIIREFVMHVRESDPDIIVGYNSNKFDWPYLLERAKLNKIKLDIGRRVDSEPTTSVHGHVSIPGRLNVDIYDFAEEVPEVKMKTLEEVSEYFGVLKKEDRVMLSWMDIPRLWSGSDEGRKLVLEYNKHDLVATLGLARKFIPFGIQLSGLTGIPLDQVMAASVGFRLEFYLMRQAYKAGELVPNRVERKAESYKGAVVLKPKPGVHEDVVVLDFTSMYPSIMIKYNVGPDTLLRPGEEVPAHVAPDVGHRFRKEPPGFFKNVLKNLLEARKRIRERLRRMDRSHPDYNIFDERQKAIKLLANAAYGYMGWPAARWYCRECAEAVTAWGRHNILQAVRKARELGLEVIYGDTDSLFLKNRPGLIDEFVKWVEEELGFEIKVDKVYKRVFFTEAKKRYVGLTVDGETDVVGFEAIRGDWAEVAKEVQFEVARLILQEGKIDKAVEYVRRLIHDLREGKVPPEKLIIWKTLTKPIKSYDVEAPHVKAAVRYQEHGIAVYPGDKIGYVIVKGPGKVSDRAYPYFAVKPEDIDANYYIDHQIIPAALRILRYFGVSEAKLRNVATSRQKSLFDYFSKSG